MQLHDFEPGFERSLGSGREGFDNFLDFGCAELFGDGMAVIKRDGTGSDGLPTTFSLKERTSTAPWRIGAGFAAGMRQLDARNGTVLLQETSDASERLNVFILPDTYVGGRNTASLFDGGSFDDDQASATEGTVAEVDQMPIVDETVLTRILAHRGNHDAVGQGDGANF